MGHLTHDTWHLTPDAWLSKFQLPAIMVWDRQCLENSEQNYLVLMNEWINDKYVYRTAPATQELVIISNCWSSLIGIIWVFNNWTKAKFLHTHKRITSKIRTLGPIQNTSVINTINFTPNTATYTLERRTSASALVFLCVCTFSCEWGNHLFGDHRSNIFPNTWETSQEG